MESMNGGTFVTFSTFLGNPGTQQTGPRKSKMAAEINKGHSEGHHDGQHGGNPHPSQAAFKKKSKRKIVRDNARAAEFQKKKKKEAELDFGSSLIMVFRPYLIICFMNPKFLICLIILIYVEEALLSVKLVN